MDEREKFLKELEQLRGMNHDDALEVMKGYHQMFRERLSESMKELSKIAHLSPVTFRLTKTAVIIAESDFFSEGEEEKLNNLYVEGNKDELAKLFTNIFKQMPELFDKVAKQAGYIKA